MNQQRPYFFGFFLFLRNSLLDLIRNSRGNQNNNDRDMSSSADDNDDILFKEVVNRTEEALRNFDACLYKARSDMFYGKGYVRMAFAKHQTMLKKQEEILKQQQQQQSQSPPPPPPPPQQQHHQQQQQQEVESHQNSNQLLSGGLGALSPLHLCEEEGEMSTMVPPPPLLSTSSHHSERKVSASHIEEAIQSSVNNLGVYEEDDPFHFSSGFLPLNANSWLCNDFVKLAKLTKSPKLKAVVAATNPSSSNLVSHMDQPLTLISLDGLKLDEPPTTSASSSSSSSSSSSFSSSLSSSSASSSSAASTTTTSSSSNTVNDDDDFDVNNPSLYGYEISVFMNEHCRRLAHIYFVASQVEKAIGNVKKMNAKLFKEEDERKRDKAEDEDKGENGGTNRKSMMKKLQDCCTFCCSGNPFMRCFLFPFSYLITQIFNSLKSLVKSLQAIKKYGKYILKSLIQSMTKIKKKKDDEEKKKSPFDNYGDTTITSDKEKKKKEEEEEEKKFFARMEVSVKQAVAISLASLLSFIQPVRERAPQS
jgi:hypothetical protein